MITSMQRFPFIINRSAPFLCRGMMSNTVKSTFLIQWMVIGVFFLPNEASSQSQVNDLLNVQLVQTQLDAYNARDIDKFLSVYKDSVKV